MKSRMRTVAKATAIIFMALAAGAQAIRPARVNPPVDSSRAIEHAVPVPPETKAILDRACANCHSSRTVWPWYSNVAPVSWFVIDHVNHGRTHLNLSDWARFPPQEADRMLGRICELVTSEEMPLGSYLVMHSEAELSPLDERAICDWTRAAQLHLSRNAIQ